MQFTFFEHLENLETALHIQQQREQITEMAASAILSATSLFHSSSPSSQLPLPNKPFTSFHVLPNRRINNALITPLISNNHNRKTDSHSSFICRAEKEYKFPDPIPEFADTVSIFLAFIFCLFFFLLRESENLRFVFSGD